jgi:hypothetical protein
MGEVRMSTPHKPPTHAEDEAPPPPGDVWLDAGDELEELDEDHDDEPTRPGGPIVGVDEDELELPDDAGDDEE